MRERKRQSEREILAIQFPPIVIKRMQSAVKYCFKLCQSLAVKTKQEQAKQQRQAAEANAAAAAREEEESSQTGEHSNQSSSQSALQPQPSVPTPLSSPPMPVLSTTTAADPIASEQTDLHTLYVVLGCLRQLCGEPQVRDIVHHAASLYITIVPYTLYKHTHSNTRTHTQTLQMVADLFVNYDCDPHAPPLFERTVQVRVCE